MIIIRGFTIIKNHPQQESEQNLNNETNSTV